MLEIDQEVKKLRKVTKIQGQKEQKKKQSVSKINEWNKILKPARHDTACDVVIWLRFRFRSIGVWLEIDEATLKLSQRSRQLYCRGSTSGSWLQRLRQCLLMKDLPPPPHTYESPFPKCFVYLLGLPIIVRFLPNIYIYIYVCERERESVYVWLVGVWIK